MMVQQVVIDTLIPVWQTTAVFHVGDVVRKLRNERGWTLDDLAAKTDTNKNTLSAIERGEGNPRLDTLLKIAKALQIPPDRLFPIRRKDETEKSSQEAELIDEDVTAGYRPNDIPVVAEGDASPSPNLFFDEAGLRSDVDDRISRPFDIRDPQAYGVRVRGDSMIPRYKPGEVLVVSPNTPVEDGDEVYVALLSGERLLKIARKVEGGWILESENRAYAARFVKKGEIGAMHPILWIRQARRARGDRKR